MDYFNFSPRLALNEPMNDEGAVYDSHWTDLGLLKKVWIACWIKMVHVKIALIQRLEICMENDVLMHANWCVNMII